MSKAVNSEGNAIGIYHNNSVKNDSGNILYRVIDGEVFQPLEYEDNNLQNMNKGQLICVGSFSNNEAVTNDGELLFKINA